jgi:hypothetical protein
LRKFAQLDHPVGILFEFFPHQGPQKMTFADALDGCAQLVDFGAELLQRAAVHQRRPAVHVQLAVGIGNGEHASCTAASVTSRLPGCSRAPGPFRKRPRRHPPTRSPATPGWKTGRSNAPGRAPAWPSRRFVFFQQLGAQDQVRFVLDRQGGAVIAADLAGTVEILAPLLLQAVPQQRDAEVIGAEAFQTAILQVSSKWRAASENGRWP